MILAILAMCAASVIGVPDALGQIYRMQAVSGSSAMHPTVLPTRALDDGTVVLLVQHHDGDTKINEHDAGIWVRFDSQHAPNVTQHQGAPILHQFQRNVSRWDTTITGSWSGGAVGRVHDGLTPNTEGDPIRATIHVNGNHDLLPTPAGTINSAATDVSLNGEIVGWADATDAAGGVTIKPIVWDGQTLSFVLKEPLPGHVSARIDGVNEHGVQVGASFVSNLDVDLEMAMWIGHHQWWRRPFSRATVWHNNLAIDLNDLVTNADGVELIWAFEVDNSGRIYAAGINPVDGHVGAYRLTPNLQDHNGDGVIDQADIEAFLADYAASDPRADATRTGVIEPADMQAFINGTLGQTPSQLASDRSENGCEAQSIGVMYMEIMLAQRDRSNAFERGFFLGNASAPADGSPCYPEDAECEPGVVPGVPSTYPKEWLDCWKDPSNRDNWDKYDPFFNPQCFGCNWDGHPFEDRRDGFDGYPGDYPSNPYYPNGGDGGNGAPGQKDGPNYLPPGNGGSGGNGAPGTGGNGGNGGDGGSVPNNWNPPIWPQMIPGKGGNGGNGAEGTPKGGDGGDGGDGGGAGPQPDVPGGAGGNGGNGAEGTGGYLNPEQGGGDGGDGGDGGKGGWLAPGGPGGNGGAGGNSGSHSGDGGDGGKGGDGGDLSSPGGKGGEGGPGGNGQNTGVPGGDGGNGGGGGDGNLNGPGGEGGAGGPGGNGGSTGAPGGGGGDGGPGGNANHGNGGPGGDGGPGGAGGGQGGNGGPGGNSSGSGPGGNGGAGGIGGAPEPENIGAPGPGGTPGGQEGDIPGAPEGD